MFKDSKAMRVWEIVYPVFLYFAVTIMVLYILDFILPETVDSKLFRQLLTSLAVLPFLYSFRKTDRELSGKKILIENSKPNALKIKTLLVMFFTGGCFALAFNNLLGMIQITKYSTSYTQVEQTFYTGRITLEIFSLVLVIPVVEELLYRGIVYERARKWLGVRPAMVVSAVIFGLIHMNLVQFIYASVFGLLLVCFAEQTGNISGAVAAHMAANFTSVLRAETEVFAFMNQSQAIWMAATIAFGAFAAAGLWEIRRLNRRDLFHE